MRDVHGGTERAQRVEVLREGLPAKVEAGADAARPALHDLALSGRSGACEKEHIPTTSVVTPCRTFDSADGQAK